MAKSLRAKSKQANRRKKRNDPDSHYAAVEASRLKAVSDRLLGKSKAEAGVTGDDKDKVEGTEEVEEEEEKGDEIEVDAEMTEAPKKVSTSGPRQNRREEWRESKGMPLLKSAGQNKQGKPIARRKAGRNKRRR